MTDETEKVIPISPVFEEPILLKPRGKPSCAVCGGPWVDEAGRLMGCEFCPAV